MAVYASRRARLGLDSGHATSEGAEKEPRESSGRPASPQPTTCWRPWPMTKLLEEHLGNVPAARKATSLLSLLRACGGRGAQSAQLGITVTALSAFLELWPRSTAGPKRDSGYRPGASGTRLTIGEPGELRSLPEPDRDADRSWTDRGRSTAPRVPPRSARVRLGVSRRWLLRPAAGR